MMMIKNRKSHPVQIPLRTADHRGIETIVIGGRGEMQIEEDRSTEMVDRLVKRGIVAVTKVV